MKKQCANSKCCKTFETKNVKRMFCGTPCKNQAAYYYKIKHYDWENKMFKALRRNIQILELFMNQGEKNVLYSELKKVGFDTSASYMPVKREDNKFIFRFGNIGLKELNKNECQLFKFI